MQRMLLALVLALGLPLAQAQVGSGSPRVFEIQPSVSLTGTTTQTGATLGGFGAVVRGICVVNVTAISGGNLTVRLQGFPDGVNPQDYAASTAIAAVSKVAFTFNANLAGPAVAALNDGSLAAGTNGVGYIGSMLRAKATLSAGSATYSLTCSVSG